MKMDLSQLTKIKETKDMATLRHPEGHEIRIAKNALSDKLKRQLSEMPIHAASGTDDPIPNPPNASTQPDDSSDSSSSDSSSNSSDNSSNQQPQAGNSPTINIINSPNGQGQQPQPMPTQMPNGITAQDFDQSDKFNAAPVSPPAQESMKHSGNVALPGPQNNQQGMNIGGAGNPGYYTGPLDAMQKLNTQQGNLEAGAFAAQAKAKQQEAAQLQANFQASQERLKNYQNEAENAISDYKNQHINTNQVWDDKSTGGKIATAIGLILGGIGGGLTGRDNPALASLNAQIDRNVAAQRENMNHKHSLYTANLEMMKNEDLAAQMTKAQLQGIAAAEVEKAGAAAQSPLAKVRAQQLNQQLKLQYAGTLNAMSMMQPTQQMAPSGPNATGMGGEQLQGGMMPQANEDQAFQKASVLASILPQDPTIKHKMIEELGEQKELNQNNKLALNAYDQVAKLNNFGNYLGPNHFQSQSKIDQYWEPMMEKLVKLTAGRNTPMSAEQVGAFKPKITDNADTLAEKRANFYNFLNQNRKTPNLDTMPAIKGLVAPTFQSGNIGGFRAKSAPSGFKKSG